MPWEDTAGLSPRGLAVGAEDEGSPRCPTSCPASSLGPSRLRILRLIPWGETRRDRNGLGNIASDRARSNMAIGGTRPGMREGGWGKSCMGSVHITSPYLESPVTEALVGEHMPEVGEAGDRSGGHPLDKVGRLRGKGGKTAWACHTGLREQAAEEDRMRLSLGKFQNYGAKGVGVAPVLWCC